jgi:hypothetical protein
VTRFSKFINVQYFHAIIYWGDQTVDNATCKLHTQLHEKATFFGNQMVYTTEIGERGLKEWAKGAPKMALKHGSDNFTLSTSSHVAEHLLIKSTLDNVRRKKTESPSSSLDSSLKIPTRSQHWLEDSPLLIHPTGALLISKQATVFGLTLEAITANC